MEDPIIEVIPREFYKSSRPGYDGKRVSETAVAEWCARAKGHGIRTILCLLDEEQLAYYTEVPGGLLDYYRQAGFVVLHHPVEDHQKPAVPSAVLASISTVLESANTFGLWDCRFRRTG